MTGLSSKKLDAGEEALSDQPISISVVTVPKPPSEVFLKLYKAEDAGDCLALTRFNRCSQSLRLMCPMYSPPRSASHPEIAIPFAECMEFERHAH